MKQYLDMCQYILENGQDRDDRTGTGTRSVFGYQTRYDLTDGFPLLTTKKMFLRPIAEELLWFIKGDTNIKYLVDRNVKIWNEWPYEAFKKSEDFHGETLEEFVAKIKELPADDPFVVIIHFQEDILFVPGIQQKLMKWHFHHVMLSYNFM